MDLASSPCVQYAYADGSANTIRATGLTYPDGRTLVYGYGAAGNLADALSRLDTIRDTAGPTILAAFAYLGLDTQVRLDVSDHPLEWIAFKTEQDEKQLGAAGGQRRNQAPPCAGL